MYDPDAEMCRSVEGSEEWSFFQTFRPACFESASGPQSTLGSTRANSLEERETKSARIQDHKGGNGKGSQDHAGGRPQGQKRAQRPWNRQGGWTKDESWPADWGTARGSSSSEWSEMNELQKLVGMMQRLVLRHEDSINLLKLDFSFVAHMRVNIPSSVVHMLYVAADGWRKLKANEPQKLDRPMRTSLFVCYFAELKERLQNIASRTDDVEKMSDLGWLVKGEPMAWQYLRWDAGAQRNVVDSSKPPLTTAEILEHIDVLLKHVVTSNSLARFHPTRPLVDGMQGESIVFLIQVGNLGDSSMHLRSSLKILCHNVVLQLVASQLKEDRLLRSTLATNIAASIRS